MQNHTTRWSNHTSVNAMAAIAIGAMLIFSVSGLKAFADNVTNDVVVGGNDTITSGGSTTVNYKIVATSGDGQTGCNAADSSSAKVTINAPTAVTASPGSLTFTACNDPDPVVFSSSTPGDYLITVSVSDSGTGTYNTVPARFTLHVNAPADTTAPEVDSTDPDDGATGVAIDSDVSATFTEKMKASTLSTSTFTVEDGADNIGGEVSLSSVGLTATFTPDADLAYSTTYTATIAGSVTDEAGNELGSDYTWTFTTEAAPDTIPPTTTATLDPSSPNGENGWYKSGVTVTLSATDNDGGSGVKSTTYEIDGGSTQTYSGPFTVSDDGQHTVTFRSEDNNGNKETDKSTSFKIDATAPQITVSGDIADGQQFYFGNVPAQPTCDATDATSGVDGSGCTVSGYSTAVGSHTLTFSAKDNAGNTATETRSYTVLAWTLKGFYQPVDMGTTLNTVKAGSTVPFKFEDFMGSTEMTSTTVNNNPVGAFSAKKVACPGGTEDPIEQVVTATGNTALRYDTTSGQFVYNWQTSKADVGSCYDVTFTDQSGSFLTAHFKLK